MALCVLIAELAVLALVLGAGVIELVQHGPARPWLSPLVGMGSFSWAATFGAVSVAVLSFLRSHGRPGRRQPSAIQHGACGRVPRQLATVSDSSGTPTIAILTAALFTMLVTFWTARQPDGLDHLVSFVDIGAVCAFIMLHVSVIGFFLVTQKGQSVFKYGMLPVIGAVILLPVLIYASGLAQIVGAVWIAIGVVILFLQGTRDTTEAA